MRNTGAIRNAKYALAYDETVLQERLEESKRGAPHPPSIEAVKNSGLANCIELLEQLDRENEALRELHTKAVIDLWHLEQQQP